MYSFIEEFKRLQLKQPRIALQFSQSENSDYTNYAFKNKNCYLVFGSHYNEDCIYLRSMAHHVKDSVDCDQIGYDPSELLYECIGISGSVNCDFCYASWHNSDLEYCEHVFNSHHCFGCISRNHAEYEILNVKYEKDEWFKRVAEIKQELRQQNLYGKWILPSTYPYEDTIAPLYF